ncbi:MAG: choice-of-anchor J domain-containing protein, partial [Duncaniella sp.]|nr:choice-of-anchor J domain-containing protein [Duncaniella sp.]
TKDWTPVNIPDYGTNTSWAFFNAGDISLAAYAGKKIQIAFRYTSTTAGGGTWEVKNVSIKK